MTTRTLSVASSNPNSGVNITVSPNDNTGQGIGSTPFTRVFNNNTSVTLTAPSTASGNNFLKWQRNGSDYLANQSITFSLDADYTFTAVYQTTTTDVLFEDDFNSNNGWATMIYQGTGSFNFDNYDNEQVGTFYMEGGPGVVYTYKKIDKTIPIDSYLKAKWFYETSGYYSNSQNSDGGSVRFMNTITQTQPSSSDIILELFAARDFPMRQWNEHEFVINKEIPAGSYISIGGAVWPSYIKNHWDYIKIKSAATDIKITNNEVIPTEFKLYQNYPNPFNLTTTIKFSIPSVGAEHVQPLHVLLKVYDLLGREIATLINEEKPPGNYEAKFDGTNLLSGLYFYTLYMGNYTETKKMLLMKCFCM